MDNAALYKMGYGLYVLTAQHEGRDNGCIINTALQVTSSSPPLGVVTVNKQNHSHDMILASKKCNISMLTVETPFALIQRFGFQSGKTVDKFADYKDVARAENSLLYLTQGTNAYLSFKVTEAFDFGTHTMFKAEITDGAVLGGAESLTYAYYHQHIKPKPQAAPSKGYRCTICGYVYEGEPLPDDFICPICKHGASDFVKIT